MVYQKRTLERFFQQASLQFPVMLLTGPRQTGKTTFLKHLAGNDRAYATLDDPMLRALAREDPALFLQRFTTPVLIDEIQYAPQLLAHIKMAVDSEKEPGRFWLTGSQQFHLMKGVTESLAGRVGVLNLLGFSEREIRNDPFREPFLPTPELLEQRRNNPPLLLPELYRKIWTGSFPALHQEIPADHDLFYSSYVQTYLQRDVRDLANVGDESAFLRFLKSCAARTGRCSTFKTFAETATSIMRQENGGYQFSKTPESSTFSNPGTRMSTNGCSKHRSFTFSTRDSRHG